MKFTSASWTLRLLIIHSGIWFHQLRAYRLWATNWQVFPSGLSFLETVLVFPSAETVERVTSTILPSRLSVASTVCSSILFTETIVLLRSPLIGVSVPSNFAA